MTYLDGMTEEGLLVRANGPADSTVVNTEVHQSGGTTITDRKHETVFSGSPGEMAAFGLRAKTL